MIRVVVTDDHHLVRQGIRSLLEQADDIEVVGEAADGYEAVEAVEKYNPDVLVIDLSMDRMNGIQATEQIRQRGLPTRIVMLSMHDDQHLVQQALRAGVKGYLLKNAIKEELLLAVRATHKGHSYLSPEVSQVLVSSLISDSSRSQQPAPAFPLDMLTPRERQILKLIAEGYTNREMSETLHVSIKTVQKHRANLMDKLDIHNIAGLTHIAIKYGLVHIE